MPTPASSFNMDKLRSSADIIEEVDGLITYLGLCERGTTLTSQPKWSIIKIIESGIDFPKTTTFLWADGICAYNLVWDNRAGYDYLFKNF